MVPVSIKDIAKNAGVSHSTVSRALRDSPLVAETTRARIQRLAREMGYSPSSIGRSLVMGRTQTIGVVVTAITDPFIAEIVQAIEDKAREFAYSVILTSSGAEPTREFAAVDMLQSKRVDGVIVISSRIGASYVSDLERLGVPVVLVNNHQAQSGPYILAVNVDNHHGGCVATEHLVQLGHRRIAYITGPAEHSDNRERLAGYRHVLTQAGLGFDAALVVDGTGTASGGEQALPGLLALAKPPTAVFCYNDMTAVGLLRAARRVGLAVPQDMAVVGFDDIALAAYFYPSLTTVAQPIVDMGQFAVEMVLTSLDGRNPPDQDARPDILVQGQLVIRESSVGRPGPA
ncbi:MAG: LacI family transcriptional regulator [Chloroflexi bacterium]|nr:LacI family transcriptional regulator [Chloroflexota bacterium]MBU1750939.1 LacI family transcriptional regulator [Chloroflexota bacterium]